MVLYIGERHVGALHIQLMHLPPTGSVSKSSLAPTISARVSTPPIGSSKLSPKLPAKKSIASNTPNNRPKTSNRPKTPSTTFVPTHERSSVTSKSSSFSFTSPLRLPSGIDQQKECVPYADARPLPTMYAPLHRVTLVVSGPWSPLSSRIDDPAQHHLFYSTCDIHENSIYVLPWQTHTYTRAGRYTARIIVSIAPCAPNHKRYPLDSRQQEGSREFDEYDESIDWRSGQKSFRSPLLDIDYSFTFEVIPPPVAAAASLPLSSSTSKTASTLPQAVIENSVIPFLQLSSIMSLYFTSQAWCRIIKLSSFGYRHAICRTPISFPFQQHHNYGSASQLLDTSTATTWWQWYPQSHHSFLLCPFGFA
jgi:hypothetical protein